ncbi:MAG: peptide ABC transporter ATP-binding protein [Spongiibacter sp.]|uniref:ABC transporter ATP-binding protein n=1 Tax=Spongiibacter sp. TaxID=2024860 RepID=UPI000C09274E|nr:ABC transporter ATP-binding protein [Spongiibacter sp.]MAK44983.1 peptide ABC transporter ATP-binding protein [Spongiibacter sp.]
MSVVAIEHLQLALSGNQVLREVSFSLEEGECRALVGESGSGKSLTAMCLLGLAPPNAVLNAEQFSVMGQPLPAQGHRDWRGWRGRRIAMIFQNPMTALSPTRTIGAQLSECFRLHRNMDRRQARAESAVLLERLAIPRAEQRLSQYPFEFSGGMLQRVMIALAVACRPKLLIADEPTTALDVTVQAEVLALLRELQHEQGTSLLFISHDLGVVANIADTVSVMYAGETVESASVASLLRHPAHPYSEALQAAMPRLHSREITVAIPGSPPDMRGTIHGCAFAPRCKHRMAICEDSPPLLISPRGAGVRCWRWHPDYPERWRLQHD